MANTLFKLNLAEIAASSSAAVNLTNAKIAQKILDGQLNFLTKGATSIGGVAVDQTGNIYVTDFEQHIVMKIKDNGSISVIAGLAGTSGNNGTLTVAGGTARFNAPRGIAVDRSGNVYVADTGNNQIRVIRDTKVAVLAGNGSGTSGFTDGVGGAATFNQPWDVVVDRSGIVYVADLGNNSIRTIKGGTVYTWAGSESGDGENVASTTRALFNAPQGVTVDNSGNVYVADTGNDKVKKITPKGWVYLFSGSTSGKAKGTTAFTAQYQYLTDITVDNSGNIYIVDQNESGTRIIRLDQNGVASVIADLVNATTYGGASNIAVDNSQKLYISADEDIDDEGVRSSSSSESSSSSST